MNYPVSDALKGLLDRKTMRKGTVGAVTKRGMKNAGVSCDSDGPQVPTKGREEIALLHGGGIRLCWVNPHMTKATGRRTSRAALVICE